MEAPRRTGAPSLRCVIPREERAGAQQARSESRNLQFARVGMVPAKCRSLRSVASATFGRDDTAGRILRQTRPPDLPSGHCKRYNHLLRPWRGIEVGLELYPVSGSSRCGHRIETPHQYLQRRKRPPRLPGADRLRPLPRTEGMARAQLAEPAGARPRDRCAHPHPRSSRSLRLDPAPGQAGIQGTDLCDAAHHRSLRHSASRLRAPTGRRRSLLQQDALFQAHARVAALHHGGGAGLP